MYSTYEKTPRKILVNLLLAILRAPTPLGVRQAVNNGLAILLILTLLCSMYVKIRGAVLMMFLESLIKP
jgi:hypothetical protein